MIYSTNDPYINTIYHDPNVVLLDIDIDIIMYPRPIWHVLHSLLQKSLHKDPHRYAEAGTLLRV